jgi:hypothetical protein
MPSVAFILHLHPEHCGNFALIEIIKKDKKIKQNFKKIFNLISIKNTNNNLMCRFDPIRSQFALIRITGFLM